MTVEAGACPDSYDSSGMNYEHVQTHQNNIHLPFLIYVNYQHYSFPQFLMFMCLHF